MTMLGNCYALRVSKKVSKNSSADCKWAQYRAGMIKGRSCPRHQHLGENDTRMHDM
jgi:hypothetical protein